MSDELPKANDPDVERIASRLFDYITTENAFPHTLKLFLCEALYEMKDLARDLPHTPTVTLVGG